jgi:hypothetical protein
MISSIDTNTICMFLMYSGVSTYLYASYSVILRMILKLFCDVSHYTSDSDPDLCNILIESITDSYKTCTYTVFAEKKERPAGLTFGKWWMAEIIHTGGGSRADTSYDIWIYGTTKNIAELLQHDTDNDLIDSDDEYNDDLLMDLELGLIKRKPIQEDNTDKLKYIVRRTSCIDSSLKIETIEDIKLNYIKEQHDIVDDIIQKVNNHYERKKKYFISVLLYGEPGTGKSVIALIIAKKLNGVICDVYDPTEVGISFQQVYDIAKPKQNSPLILLINELDKKLDFIISNPNSAKHKWLRVEIRDKTTWNDWFEKIYRKQFIIALYTSNKPPEYFDDIDSSLIRPGRIDFKIEIKNKTIMNNYVSDNYDDIIKVDVPVIIPESDEVIKMIVPDADTQPLFTQKKDS